jgi:hypothetical protein
MKNRYLTKSRYKTGLECPNKLFFTKKEKEYFSAKSDDTFLQALASGGFQVEELARLHYPEGILVEEQDQYDYDTLANTTATLLKRENVVIFEAAFLVEGLFIRTDILVKKENKIELIEVKAKSYHPEDQYTFSGKRGAIKPTWKPYLFDVAFQKYVIEKSNPLFSVTPYLMLADKSKTTIIEGLNQKFRISKQTNERTGIIRLINKLEDPSKESVLSKVNISDLIERIETSQERMLEGYAFEQSILALRDSYAKDQYFNFPIECSSCNKCEFKASSEEELNGLKSGFEYCWSKQLSWDKEAFKKPNLFEVWDYRSWQKIQDPNEILLECITEDHLGGVKPEPGRLSRTARQWIQIEKSQANDNSLCILKAELKEEMDTWKFPLNFIDFETSTVALPFYSGQRPYEQVAFQFSHHIYHENGTIEHATEFINTSAGVYPNFIFARALKAALSKNSGSVFKFATHENTIVNSIVSQLEKSQEEDKVALIQFLKSISHSKREHTGTPWKGERDMIDLCDVIKKFYYNPYTKGSNSIKKVLPAVFESSQFVKNKYSKTIKDIGVSSKNFPDTKVWLKADANKIIDPYKSLPKVFEDFDESFVIISEMEDISDGGAALTAYGKLQYTDMEEKERTAITNSLLKYCELDTLAMVMIYEHLRELV